MRPRLLLTIIAIGVFAVIAPRAGAAVHLSQLGSFSQPVYITSPPSDGSRLFVVQRAGQIIEVHDGQTLATPFLDIRGDVKSSGTEQGLLSMAFAPDYATSRKFYVYYTAPRAGDSSGSVITVQEFQTVPGNPDAVDPGTRRTVFTVDHPGQTNHNGGQLEFGPDGLLYAGTGDGGGGDDQGANRPSNNAQNLSSQLGKLLRVDPDAGGAPSIYAYGLRNPWRFSFDRQTGDLTIGDVGQTQREEVDFAPAGTPAGTNYGWVCWEGTLKNANASPPCDPGNDVFPVLEKTHSGDGYCAIVGGYVVRDPALTGLTGRYVYGDNCAARIRSAQLTVGGANGDNATGLSVSGLTSFGEDACGHLFATSGNGPVYRIDGDAFTPCGASAPTPGPTPGPSDTRAPRVKVGGKKRQRVLRQRGLRVSLVCDETCGVTVRTKIRIAGSRERYGLKTATRLLPKNKRAKATLRFTKRSKRAVAKALRRHRRVTFTVTATARDSSNNARNSKKTVRARL